MIDGTRSAAGWETGLVFISSTFQDIHTERDYLDRKVFPGLRDWCEERGIRLIDVDLPWDITEPAATRHKQVVEVCQRNSELRILGSSETLEAEGA